MSKAQEHKPDTIEGSHTLWYKIQHNWVGGDGFWSHMLEGLMMIGMALFFLALLGFSRMVGLYEWMRYRVPMRQLDHAPPEQPPR